jgi:hypothetical protein
MNMALTSAMGKKDPCNRYVASNFEKQTHGRKEKILPCATWFYP